jgi:hypothetical protein
MSIMRWLVFVALGSLFSCGDEFETEEGPDRPCNENPWSCPEDQTCWPSSPNAFECLNASGGDLNAACNLAVGSPQCLDGLICYQTEQHPMGVCRPFCDPVDPERACPDGAVCDILRLSNGPPPIEVRVCRPPF